MSDDKNNPLDEPSARDDPAASKRTKTKRIVQSLISIVIVVGIFVGVMPQIADYDEVWATIRSLTWLESTSLAIVALWNLATYWFVLVAALPGLRLREAAVVNQSSTAVSNTLPGGGAIGVGVTLAMLTSWGFNVPSITRSAVVTGIWNNFVKLGMPILALGLLAIESEVSNAWVSASAIGLAALVGAVVGLGMILRSDKLARSVGASLEKVVSKLLSVFRKPPVSGWSERAARFRNDTIGLLQHRWLQLTLSTMISHLSLYIVLLLTLRHVGVGQEELSWIQVLAAFSFVRLISALPVTPGGVGVVELGYAAALTIGLDEMAKAQVVAAILVFRTITYVLPIPLGATAYVIWRRNRSWRLDEHERAELAGDAYVTSGV
ncbi:MAG: lysylphosphatidylglycerol synthase transmembrane domain-containing protein [Acidimicrobiia bacterium]|nr:lysylphosphatidylglycerol synthase transmembrane domain-containing protein [Acidimicrobiia bacterium]